MLPTSYVYLHRDPKTHEVRYVGAGSKGRAWACGSTSCSGPRRGNRTKEHQAWLDSLFNAGYTMSNIVVIIAQGLQAAEAREIEKEEILQYGTLQLFNIQTKSGLLKLNTAQLLKAKVLRDQGSSYNEIALLVEVSTMTIYRALNNQTKGYENVITN